MATVNSEPVKTRKGTGYVCRWRGANGGNRQQVVYGKTKTQALKWAREQEHKAKFGEEPAKGARSLKFRDAAEEWLSLDKRRSRTTADHRRNLDRWVLPRIGGVPLTRLQERDLKALLTFLRSEARTAYTNRKAPARPLSPRTVEKIMMPVVAVLRYAVQRKYLPANPAEGLAFRAPAGPRTPKAVALEWDEVLAIATAAEDPDRPAAFAIRFLGMTGVRAGEWMALRICDVQAGTRKGDPDELVITRSLSQTGQPDEDDLTKSVHSNRTVPVFSAATGTTARGKTTNLATDLRNYLAEHPRRDDPSAPLFPRWMRNGVDWGKPVDADHFRKKVLGPAVTAAGLAPIRLHDLRHTAGSLWIAAGHKLTDVSQWLGHASPEFTARVYIHQLSSSKQEANAAIAAMTAKSVKRAKGTRRNLRAV